MSRVTDLSSLAQYILRRLGHPVIQVNVSDDQILDCIDETLQKYYEFHADGTYRAYIAYEITQDVIDSGFLPIDEQIITATRLIDANDTSLGMNLANNLANQHIVTSMIATATSTVGGIGGRIFTEASLGTYQKGFGQFQSNMNYLRTISDMFRTFPTIKFVKHGHKIRLDAGSLKLGTTVILECYIKNDAEDYEETYNDHWVKRYAIAMVKKQWANNLIKYNGFQLPSGITIDGTTILQEANADLEKLERELRETWEEPILPIIG